MTIVRAVVHQRTDGPDVLRVVERPEPQPGPGEVRVRMCVSGVNPTDIKARSGSTFQAALPRLDHLGQVPHQDDAATGLPLHRFPLERIADAHAAVEAGTVGKVLVDLA